MILLLAIVVGALYTVGLYMVMRRSLVKILIGLMLLAQAINLLIFTTGRLIRGSPPLIPAGANHVVQPVADPLPQAMILTAIVISFGVTAFALVLARQTYTRLGTNDMNDLRNTDIQPQYSPESFEVEE